MQTKLMFSNSLDKRKVVLIHSKDVAIFQESRKEIMNLSPAGEGYREHIIIRYPKYKQKFINIKLTHKISSTMFLLITGYQIREMLDYVEISFYKEEIFTPIFYDLEKSGLFKIIQKQLAAKNRNELFSMYINPNTIYQWLYNIIFSTLQIPYQLYKTHKKTTIS